MVDHLNGMYYQYCYIRFRWATTPEAGFSISTSKTNSDRLNAAVLLEDSPLLVNSTIETAEGGEGKRGEVDEDVLHGLL